ncbi:MAG TPA: hypothetical protein VMH04_07110 [Candidatus Solibacter sp.]|nr:hypothetical protein [Candidatus Solibacter sp.]
MTFKGTKAGRWSLGLFCLLCASVANCCSLDREAFSFTTYDLTLQVEPDQHRLGVRGRVTLRNDTQTPQKIAVLQISSSLSWKSIKAGESTLQIVTQPFISDIDHTGALSEAIVTLPQPVAPKGTIDLVIAYEGVVLPDATRFTRTGVPDDVALSTDWDQIGADFTALRGAGYVAWYPIATDVANLSDEDSLSEVLKRWNDREADGKMDLTFKSTADCTILSTGYKSLAIVSKEEGIAKVAVFHDSDIGHGVPAFTMANYKEREAGTSKIYYLGGKDSRAESYAELVANLRPLSAGRGPGPIQVAELPNADAAPFLAGRMLFMPLKPAIPTSDRLTLVYALSHTGIDSPQRWVTDGIAHCAQVLDIENEQGYRAALDYLASHLEALVEFENASAASGATETGDKRPARALVDMSDEVPLESKAMFVWWMLHDMMPEFSMGVVLKRETLSDKDAGAMQKLLEEPAKRDLQWFFDDWVYHDRGLPDFKVESAFPVKTPTNSYMVTVTVANLGSAGAEVPVKIKFAGGETTKRLEVRAKSKATIRIEVPAAPQEVVVNDGSVPESDLSDDTFKISQGPK